MANDRVQASAGTTYEDGPVRAFALAAVLWGVVGMAVGVFIAAQLAWPELNFGISWLSYGRLRPLHTNAVIFAFGGCTLLATSLPRGAAHGPDAAVRCPSWPGSISGPGRRSSLARRITLPHGLHDAARNTPSSNGPSTS